MCLNVSLIVETSQKNKLRSEFRPAAFHGCNKYTSEEKTDISRLKILAFFT